MRYVAGKYSWIVWAFGSLFLLYQFLLQTSGSVMIPSLEQAFHINAAGVGLLSSSYFYTYLVMQVPAGFLVDRFGARRLLVAGMLICAMAVWLFANAQTVAVAEFSRLLMGLVAAPAFAAALFLVANWFPPERFATIVGFTELLGMSGSMLGQVYLAASIAHVGWRETLVRFSILGILIAISVWVIVRDRPRKSIYQKPTHATSLIHVFSHLWKVMGLPQVWVIGLFSGLTFALISAMGGLWGVPYLTLRYGASPTLTAFASSMIFVGVGFGCPFFGWVSDRVHKRKPVMALGTLSCLAILLCVLYLPNIPFGLMFALMFALGFTSSVYMIPFALVSEITPKEARGTAVGLTNMLSIVIGSPILQPIIGRLLELNTQHQVINGVQIFQLRDYQLTLGLLPIILLLALVTLLFIRETDQPVEVVESLQPEMNLLV